MSKFAKLIDDKKINLLAIGDITKEELMEIGQKVGLEKVSKKTLELLRREIGHLGKLSLAGQVIPPTTAPQSFCRTTRITNNNVLAILETDHFCTL